jgi:predicted ArsR family transcriptional regulator
MEIDRPVDRLEAIGDKELRATYAYAVAQARPVTADEIADAQGLHRNVARSRLERLTAAGLLSPGYERRTGRTGPGSGRPAKTYRVEPHLRAIEFPARSYEKLVRLLIDALPTRTGRAQLHEVGLAFADELLRAVRLQPARTLLAAAERVCETVRALGFHAAVAGVSDTSVIIETAVCPLRPLVREDATAAVIDRGMWTGLTAAGLAGVDAERLDCDTDRCLADGLCRVTLALRNGRV